MEAIETQIINSTISIVDGVGVIIRSPQVTEIENKILNRWGFNSEKDGVYITCSDVAQELEAEINAEICNAMQIKTELELYQDLYIAEIFKGNYTNMKKRLIARKIREFSNVNMVFESAQLNDFNIPVHG